MFSIIVPFANKGSDLVIPFLNSLYPLAFDDDEVIFVGNSADSTYDITKALIQAFPGSKLIMSAIGSSYAQNVNIGAKEASQPFLIITNNDVIFPENFLERMLAAYKKAKSPGMIGPLSNAVMSSQVLTTPYPKDVDRINEQLKNDIVFASVISGFCFLIERELFHNVGMLDERFWNGNEDVDLSIRLLESGRTNYVNYGAYVWHEGSHSLPANCVGGVYNRHILARKLFSKPKDYKLGCYLTFKGDKKELDKWLNRHVSIFDVIIVIADTNDVPWKSYESENLIIYTGLIGESEGARRVKGVEIARKVGVEALVNLDHDEFFEPKVDRVYLQRLLNLPLPGKLGFVGRFLHLWNDKNHFREDYVPKNHMFMIKLLPGILYHYNDDDEMFHGARLPSLPPSSLTYTNIRILHEGYISYELREAKRQYYEAEDKFKNKEDIGFPDYSHMVNEENMIIIPWTRDSEDYKISLNMMAEHERPYQLQIALENIATTTDEIVIRIGRFKKELVEIAKRFGAKVIIDDWTFDFSYHRNKMLKESTSKYIFFLDPDEMIARPDEIVDLVNKQPDGALFSFDVNEMFITEAIRLFVKKGAKFNGLIHESVESSIGDNVLRAPSMISHITNIRDKRSFYREMNERMIDLFPDDPRPYLDEGIRLKYDGEFVKSEEMIQKAVRLNSNYLQAKIELIRLKLLSSYLISKDVDSMISDNHPLKRLAKSYTTNLRRLINPAELKWFLGG